MVIKVRGVLSVMPQHDKTLTNCAQLLLDAGAAINHQIRHHGWTALMLAVRQGHTNVVKILVVHGAWVDQPNDSNATALIWAAEKGAPWWSSVPCRPVY
jgi:ankyrin repeat protein